MSDSVDGAYQFLITPGAAQDMRDCKGRDPKAAAFLVVFLQELRGDPDLCERMIDTSYSDKNVESIDGVWSLQERRINAYRAKFVEYRFWRLIFIVDRLSARIGLFSIMHRDDDYESDTRLWQDIEREFDELGFTKY